MNQPIRLHPVRRDTKASNRYCGPAIISALTGLDTRDTAALIRSIYGRRQVTGSSHDELSKALTKLGFRMRFTTDLRDLPKRQRPTFVRWLRETKPGAGQTYLLAFGGHWALLQGRRYICGITKTAVPLSQVPHRRARVKLALVVEQQATMDYASVIAAIPSIAVKTTFLSQTADRMAVKRLAEPYGVEVDDSNRDKDDPNGTIWVYPGSQWPKGLADPFDDEHYHDDYASAKAAIETYIAAIKGVERPSGVKTLLTAAQPSGIVTA